MLMPFGHMGQVAGCWWVDQFSSEVRAEGQSEIAEKLKRIMLLWMNRSGQLRFLGLSGLLRGIVFCYKIGANSADPAEPRLWWVRSVIERFSPTMREKRQRTAPTHRNPLSCPPTG